MKTTLARRGVRVRLEKRHTCCFCRELIMPGQAYRFANIDPKAATIRYLHGHVLCGDERAKLEPGEGSGVSDETILKFWAGVEALKKEDAQ